MNTKLIAFIMAHRHTNKYKTKSTSFWLLNILKRRSIVSNTSYRTLNIRSKYKCLHVISPERNKAILTWIIQNIVDLWKSNIYHASAIQNKFWPPPSFQKTSWSLNYFPGITTSLQTDRHKFSNRNPFSYPEPFLRAVNRARRGALAKSISNWLLIGHNEIYGLL